MHMVLGFMADKDVETMLGLMPKSAHFYFTQAETVRSMTAATLQSLASQLGYSGEAFDHVAEALDAARSNAGEKDLVYVGGSMYVLAELLKSLGYDDGMSDHQLD